MEHGDEKAKKGGGKIKGPVESFNGLATVGDVVGVGPIGRELMVSVVELSESYDVITRAWSVILMGKQFGMEMMAQIMFPSTEMHSRLMRMSILKVVEVVFWVFFLGL